MRERKGFTLFILIEDMNDIIKIIKLTVKHGIKKKKADFLGLC